ncbi:MAG TPA: ABC transporter substrate-binding protein [Bacillota bacterium]|nr:ABC transporter substrate-binding protein [Bacillota bacterium]
MVKKVSILLVFCLLLSLLAACGQTNVQPDAGKKDSVIIGLEENAQSLDPQYCGDAFGFSVMMNIFDPLFRADKNGDVYPVLVKDWNKSDDGKVYTFNLKEGIKYHNGDELKAEDVKYTFERAIESPYATDLFSCIDSIKVLSDYSVEVTLKYPYDAFMSILYQPAACIVSRKIVEASESFDKNPIGTGPYKLVEWKGAESIILTAFEDYHLGEASIKDVEFRIIMDKSTGMIALEKGEIDAYVNIASTDRQALIDNDAFAFYEVPSYFCYYLELNNLVEPFNDLRVRQAIAYSIDKGAIIDSAQNGIAEEAHHQVPPGIFGGTDQVKSYPRDLEKAKALLTEAGYPDGFDITLTGLEAYTKTLQVLQSNLTELGLNVEIQVLEFGTFLDEIFGPECSAFVVEYGVFYPDADAILYRGYHSDFFGPLGNFPRYSNSEMDALLEKARVSSDKAEREALYVEILTKLNEDVPNVPLYMSTTNIGCRKELKGVYAQPQMIVYVYEYSWE